MKKALAILMVLAAFTGVVFADVADVAVSGNATLSWGVDLNDNKPNGFNNEAEWTVTIPLLAKKTFTTKSEGDAYAEISINDAVYVIEGDEDGDEDFTAGDKEIDSVSAKLVFGNVYMTVYDAPGFDADNADIWEPIATDDYYDDANEGETLEWAPSFDGYGTKIGYKTDMFDVAFKLASQLTWSRAEAAAAVAATWDPITGELTAGSDAVTAEGRKSKYAFGFDASVTPSEMITASATFNYAAWEGAPDAALEVADNIMTAGFVVEAKPVADVVVKAALDAGSEGTDLDGERAWSYDAIVSASYKFVEAGVYYASIGTPYTAGDAATAPFKSVNDDGELIADLAAYLKVTDGDMVPNLNAWGTVIAQNLLTSAKFFEDTYPLENVTAPLAIGVGADYTVKMNDVNYVKPYGELYAQNMAYGLGKTKGTEFVTAQTVGVEYGLFTNTTVTAEYAVGSTADDKLYGLIDLAASSDMGVFTLACKVTY